MTFRVGQKVVCIKNNAWFPAFSFEAFPEFNGVYTVRAVHFALNMECLHLVEIVNPIHQYSTGEHEAMFAARNFRPAVDTQTDISIFTAMLTPAQKETV